MIRTLYKSDLYQILSIENSVHVVPWTEETFKACFDAGYFGWVMEMHDKIIAFIIISLTKEECHVLNIGVTHTHQHQGHGQKLLEHVLQHAKQQGIGVAYLEVRLSNSKAIALYKKLNFQLIGERKGYYPTVSGNEDALIFAKSLVSPDA